MRGILVLSVVCACFVANASSLDAWSANCENDCYKMGFKAKPKEPLRAKDIRMFAGVYGKLENEDQAFKSIDF